MTKEKAIEIFKRLKENAPNEMHLETVGTAQELFEMAIQALSQVSEIEENIIKYMKKYPNHVGNTDFWEGFYACRNVVLQLDDEECSPKEQEPCDDAISRKDAEQMFRNIRGHLKPQDYKSAEEFNTRDLMLLNAEQMIHDLPSVTQKSGKWINDENYIPICNKCGYIPPYDRAIDDYEYSNYCPSCGCRMVEPKESEVAE